MRIAQILLFIVTATLQAACAGSEGPRNTTRLDLDSRRPRQMAEFYLGAYGTADQVASALSGTGTDIRLQMDSLGAFAPALASFLATAASDGELTREELAAGVAATYYTAIGAPQTAEMLRTGLPTELLTFEVSGSMTRYRRRLMVGRDAVQGALTRVFPGNAEANGAIDSPAAGTSPGRLIYETGTLIVGEHLRGAGDGQEGATAETTAMVKREDGYWNFLAYDSTGSLTSTIYGDPDALAVPADCFGCHYGTRLFEPERSFPGNARPGPLGERAVYVSQELRRVDAASLLDEHRRRSDGLLGLYGTLYLSDLLNRAEEGLPMESEDLSIIRSVR
ncbi:MAG: hypothetical protein ACI80V_000016 [Rhodothermales bacterium]